MKGLSLNVAAIVLYIAGSVIISGSNIWIMKNGLDPGHVITVAASNLASIFSIGVGAVLTQVDLRNKSNHVKELSLRKQLDMV